MSNWRIGWILAPWPAWIYLGGRTWVGHWAQVQQRRAPGGLGCACHTGTLPHCLLSDKTHWTQLQCNIELCLDAYCIEVFESVADKWCLAQGQIPTKHVCLAISSNMMTLMSTKMTKMTMSLTRGAMFLAIISKMLTLLVCKKVIYTWKHIFKEDLNIWALIFFNFYL